MYNAAIDNPQAMVPIGRLDRITALRSPLAITDLAVLPAQLNFMSNFRLTAGSGCFSLQTTSLRKRDIKWSCASRGKSVGAQHVGVCPGLHRLSSWPRRQSA